MKRIRLKAILSSFLLLMFLLLFASGVMLHIGKTGLILGFSRAFLTHFHAWLSLLLLLLICCHLVLNWRMFCMELKKLFDRNPASVKNDGADKREQQ